LEGKVFAARTLERELERMDTMLKKLQIKVLKFHRYLIREERMDYEEGDIEKVQGKINKLAKTVIQRQNAVKEEEKQRQTLMKNPLTDKFAEQKTVEARVLLFLESLYEAMPKPYYHYI
jgi:hypothetical protein